jgi:hypothetical protein
MYCQAVTPDGRRLTFDDILRPGQVVYDRDRGGNYVVGPDLGDEDPRLMPMDRDHYMAYWHAINPHVAALSRNLPPEGDSAA